MSNALVYPLNIRCLEISRLVDEYSSNELQNIFPTLVADIFGITNQIGWGLRSIVKSYNPHDYNVVLEFFHPQGAFLRLCYKLMASNNFYIKYDFPLAHLPVSIMDECRKTSEWGQKQNIWYVKDKGREPQW